MSVNCKFLWNSVIFVRTCFIFEEFGNVVRPSVRCHLVIFNITIAVYAAAVVVVFFLHLFLSTCFIVSSYLLHAHHTLYGVWCLEWIPEGRLMVGCLLGWCLGLTWIGVCSVACIGLGLALETSSIGSSNSNNNGQKLVSFLFTTSKTCCNDSGFDSLCNAEV